MMEFSNNHNSDDFSDEMEMKESLRMHLKKLGWCSVATVILVIAFIHLNLLFPVYKGFLYSTCIFTHVVVIFPLLLWWWKNRIYVNLDNVIQNFGVGYFIMPAGVLLTASISVTFVAILSTYSYTLGNIFSFSTIFIVIGWEEFFKVIYAKKFKSKIEVNREEVAHQVAFTSVSVGYATFNASVVCAFVFAVVTTFLDGTENKLILAAALITMVLFFVLPMQILSGYMIGLNTTRGLPQWKIGLEPILLRSLLALMTILALVLVRSSVAAMLSLFASHILIMGILIFRIKLVEKLLPREYLIKVGYLQMFGYGLLADEDQSIEVEVIQRRNTVTV